MIIFLPHLDTHLSSSDCLHGEDDIECGEQNLVNRTEVCKVDEFECLEHNFCIHSSWTCDGDRDCPTGSDERKELCEGYSDCGSYNFKCWDGRCLPNETLCPEEKLLDPAVGDAVPGADACLSVPPVCSQTCLPGPVSHKCDCLEGYIKGVHTD